MWIAICFIHPLYFDSVSCLCFVECDIGDILGDKNKIRMLVILMEKGPLKKTELYHFCSNNALNARKLDELSSVGLVILDVDRFQNNQTTVSLTSMGISVAKKLVAIRDIISGEVPVTEPTTNHSAFSEVLDSLNTSE